MRFKATFEKEGCFGSVEFDVEVDAPLNATDIDNAVTGFARSLSRWSLAYVEQFDDSEEEMRCQTNPTALQM